MTASRPFSVIVTNVYIDCLFPFLKQFLGAFTKLRKANIGIVMYVRLSVHPSAWDNSALTGWIFIKFSPGVFFEDVSTKFKFD